jgi:hypothetical protein
MILSLTNIILSPTVKVPGLAKDVELETDEEETDIGVDVKEEELDVVL